MTIYMIASRSMATNKFHNQDNYQSLIRIIRGQLLCTKFGVEHHEELNE